MSIHTTFYILNTMGYKSTLLPLLLERVGERRIKSTIYIPLGNCSCIALPPASMQSSSQPGALASLSLKGEGADTCVDTYAYMA
jgi:hypothetical protein